EELERARTAVRPRAVVQGDRDLRLGRGHLDQAVGLRDLRVRVGDQVRRGDLDLVEVRGVAAHRRVGERDGVAARLEGHRDGQRGRGVPAAGRRERLRAGRTPVDAQGRGPVRGGAVDVPDGDLRAARDGRLDAVEPQRTGVVADVADLLQAGA